MTTLLYRGQKYIPYKDKGPVKTIKLSYTQSTYSKKRYELSKTSHLLTYRGIKYIPLAYKGFLNEVKNKVSQKEVFLLAKDLINAQFTHGDDELCRRLWDEVGLRRIDPNRVINLMYTCCSDNNDQSMKEADRSYIESDY